MVRANQIAPSRDASLGLIYRLNILWQRMEEPASTGQFDKWNFLLDRVFCNLMYRNALETEQNEDGKIINVKLNNDDVEVYRILNRKVKRAKEKVKKAKSKSEYAKSKEKLYNALMLKDVGLRKFMHKLGLYMKEYERNPGNAMWGG